MAWGKRSVTLPTELEEEVKKVGAVAPPPPQVNLIYKYLRRVYELQGKIASSSEWQKAIQKYHAAHAPRTLKNYTGIIIMLTASDRVTSNMKYKYVTALEYAFANNVKPENLRAFIEDQGGLNKCVELWNKKCGSHPKKIRECKTHEVPVLYRSGYYLADGSIPNNVLVHRRPSLVG
jgi:hypothetical protein